MINYDREKYFCLEIFLSLNISDFSLCFFFVVKIATPLLKQVTPSFLVTPLSKLRPCHPPPFFWKLGRRFNPPPPGRKKGCTLCSGMCAGVCTCYHLYQMEKTVMFLFFRQLNSVKFNVVLEERLAFSLL